MRRSNTKANPAVKGSKAKAAASPEEKLANIHQQRNEQRAWTRMHFKSLLRVRRSESFVQCVQEDSGREDPADCRVQQAYAGSDDHARILKQVDGLDMHMEHEHILNKYDFTDWNVALRMLKLPYEVLGKLPGRASIKGTDDDSDVLAHLSDQKEICKALAGSFRVRYTSALPDPRVIAMKVFEHRLWPSAESNDGDDLQRFGIDQISRLLNNYSTFFDGVDNQQCMLQWNRPKRITMKDPVLRSLPLEELWPRILLKWVS